MSGLDAATCPCDHPYDEHESGDGHTGDCPACSVDMDCGGEACRDSMRHERDALAARVKDFEDERERYYAGHVRIIDGLRARADAAEDQRDTLAAENARLGARVAELEARTPTDAERDALAYAGSWPPKDVVAKLVGAANHLLDDHGCDQHGYEGLQVCVAVAKNWLTYGECISALRDTQAKSLARLVAQVGALETELSAVQAKRGLDHTAYSEAMDRRDELERELERIVAFGNEPVRDQDPWAIVAQMAGIAESALALRDEATVERLFHEATKHRETRPLAGSMWTTPVDPDRPPLEGAKLDPTVTPEEMTEAVGEARSQRVAFAGQKGPKR